MVSQIQCFNSLNLPNFTNKTLILGQDPYPEVKDVLVMEPYDYPLNLVSFLTPSMNLDNDISLIPVLKFILRDKYDDFEQIVKTNEINGKIMAKFFETKNLFFGNAYIIYNSGEAKSVINYEIVRFINSNPTMNILCIGDAAYKLVEKLPSSSVKKIQHCSPKVRDQYYYLYKKFWEEYNYDPLTETKGKIKEIYQTSSEDLKLKFSF